MNNAGKDKSVKPEFGLKPEDQSKRVQFQQVMEIKNEAETIKFSVDDED